MYKRIWFKIGFPLFSQKRPGLNNKIFVIYKFKTLYDSKRKLSEKKRQNKFGEGPDYDDYLPDIDDVD